LATASRRWSGAKWAYRKDIATLWRHQSGPGDSSVSFGHATHHAYSESSRVLFLGELPENTEGAADSSLD